jgi:hypothetical protein
MWLRIECDGDFCENEKNTFVALKEMDVLCE